MYTAMKAEAKNDTEQTDFSDMMGGWIWYKLCILSEKPSNNSY